MILVTGGCCQGKRQFVKKSFGLIDADFSQSDACEFDDAFSKPALDHLERLVARAVLADRDPTALIENGLERNGDIILVCDETGCGIVPADRQDRAIREAAGRIACLAASRAEKVYRVCCGIPMLIKGK